MSLLHMGKVAQLGFAGGVVAAVGVVALSVFWVQHSHESQAPPKMACYNSALRSAGSAIPASAKCLSDRDLVLLRRAQREAQHEAAGK